MGILQGNPRRVLHYFEEICAIPHGSGHCGPIAAYCVEVANGLGLSVRRDEQDNVVIKKPAFVGYENREPVILQGHLDMVCEKNPDCTLDFEKDGLVLQTDGQWIWADGTTLGGDDGIAVAMGLAILEDNTLPHPPLEVVFTTDEETGMFGAAGLDVSDLQGKILLNADSECEGVLTVSCAGGARAELVLPLTREENKNPVKKLTFRGLQGGHSGVEIDKGRINADILMGHFLQGLNADFRIVSVQGGTKDNAIPAAATCEIATATDLTAYIRDFTAKNRPESDPGLVIDIADSTADSAFDKASTARIFGFLTATPNGIQAMSKNIEGLPETSLNLGQLNSTDQALIATFSVRSSVGKAKKELLQKLEDTAKAFGGTFSYHGDYPAWEYKEDSRLRNTMVEVYEKLYGKKPVVEAIHAGLECGFFCDKIPGLDAVSFGPDMRDIHTPREKLSIPSVGRTYDYLLAILKEL